MLALAVLALQGSVSALARICVVLICDDCASALRTSACASADTCASGCASVSAASACASASTASACASACASDVGRRRETRFCEMFDSSIKVKCSEVE